MKTLKNLLFLCILAVLTACSDDAFVPQSEVISATVNGSVDYISMMVPDIEIDDATTRSKLIDDGTELKFVWQENDAIGVVPMIGRPLSFPIHAENAQKNIAVFDGGQWALRTDAKYAAFFPYKKTNYEKDAKNIIIDYTGQMQGNWTKYDFLATGAVQPKDGAVKFTMKRLSAILKVQVDFSATNSHFQYVTLVAPEPLFGVRGTLDLSGSEPVYTPEGLTKFINTDLGVDKDLSSSEQNVITFYLMIPPTNLSGKELKLLFNSDSGTAKEAIFDGQNFEAGKAYSIDVKASDAFIRNANLIVAAGLGDGSISINARVNREKILQVKSINVSDKNDPTVCDEIGFFRNLEELRCYGNGITSLDVSNNSKLTYLSCSSNQLTSLNVSNNSKLTYLSCSSNQLTSLDVSNNTALNSLYCYSNQLTSLDGLNNTTLKYLDCGGNQLTSLDVSNNTALTEFYCNSNQLISLDVSSNTALTLLHCYSNQLISLDVSNNTALEVLQCTFNKLTSLDVSNNMDLQSLDCGSNQLISLDVSNNTALTYLNCRFNQLTSLNVSNNTALSYLQCCSNQLTSLNVLNNTALKNLYCYSNQLNVLNLSKNTALTDLECYSNRLTALDVSKCLQITWPSLRCGRQLDSSGRNQYILVNGNDAMEQYLLEKGTIYSPTSYNYYVDYKGKKYP